MSIRFNAVIAAGTALALTACATTTDNEPVDAAAKKLLDSLEPTGETRQCLNITRVRQIRPVTERLFLVRAGVSDYYRTEIRGRCNGATRQGNRLQYRTAITQICGGQIVQIIDNNSGFTQGSCAFGSFERMAPKEDAGDEGADS
ncbi:MAG: hypothetical protein ACFB00_02570 [Parvularculaceae bacterium]